MRVGLRKRRWCKVWHDLSLTLRDDFDFVDVAVHQVVRHRKLTELR